MGEDDPKSLAGPAVHRWRVLASVALGAIPLFAAVLLTMPRYGTVFDEPIYAAAARHVEGWLSLPFGEMLSEKAIDAHWRTDPERNVHPAGLKWMAVAARRVLFWMDIARTRDRVFWAGFFALSFGLFAAWATGYSPPRTVLAAALLASFPHFFAHAHFAVTDLPLAAAWMLFCLCLTGWEKRWGVVAGAFALGFFCSLKFTAVPLAAVTLAVFFVGNRSQARRFLLRSAMLAGLALVVFLLLNPDYWPAPLARASEFLGQTFSRRSWAPISVLYFGTVYAFRAPWHYPLAMFALTTPPVLLATALGGIAAGFSRGDVRRSFPFPLCTAAAAVPFLLLVLPASPATDGVRYLLPAYPFLALAAENGWNGLWRKWRALPSGEGGTKAGAGSVPARRRLPRGAWLLLPLLAWAVEGIQVHLRHHPRELSYYNALAGGVAGAWERGLETTYYWEPLDCDVLRRVDALCRGRSVAMRPSPTDHYLRELAEAGLLHYAFASGPEFADFLLIYGRPSVIFWETHLRAGLLLAGRTPRLLFQVVHEGVPLLRLYALLPPIGPGRPEVRT